MLAIIQARMSSRRLPGKVLMNLAGQPLLKWTVDRLRVAKQISDLVVATSDDLSDNPIADYAQGLGLTVYRGPLNDVASRFCQVVKATQCPAFVRVCGDSPLIDPYLIDRGIALYQSQTWDLVTNVWPRSFPKGQSVEVIQSARFLSAAQTMTGEEREHITQAYYRHPQSFKIVNFANNTGSSNTDLSAIQLSVDTLADHRQMEALIKRCPGPVPGWADLVALQAQIS